MESVRAQRAPVVDKFIGLFKTAAFARNLLKMIPENGYSPVEIERALTGGLPVKYPGLLAWCRWIFGRTGNVWLDKTGEGPAWTRKNVDQLKRDYAGYRELDKQMKAFNNWLDPGRADKYAEIIAYVHDLDPQRVRTRVRVNAR
jgi:hypothetical protein